MRGKTSNHENPRFGPKGEPLAARIKPASGHAAIGDHVGLRSDRGDGASYFAKPSLDDMGPGTDTATPTGLFRKNTLDEMTVRRTEQPVVGKLPPKPGEDLGVVRRGKIGVGSYEDPVDEKKRKRRPGKTGRPGR